MTGELILLVSKTTTKLLSGSITVKVPVHPWCPKVLLDDCVPKYHTLPLSPSLHQPNPHVGLDAFLFVNSSIISLEKNLFSPYPP